MNITMSAVPPVAEPAVARSIVKMVHVKEAIATPEAATAAFLMDVAIASVRTMLRVPVDEVITGITVPAAIGEPVPIEVPEPAADEIRKATTGDLAAKRVFRDRALELRLTLYAR